MPSKLDLESTIVSPLDHDGITNVTSEREYSHRGYQHSTEPSLNNPEPNARRTAASLPLDILAAIFLEAMNHSHCETDSYDPSVPTVRHLSGVSPIQLGHVCSHWRNVVESTSEIWSTICIDNPRRSHLNLTDLWLERAGTHPLQITIKTSRVMPVHAASFTAILRLFVNKIDLWREIDFDIPLEMTETFSQMLAQREASRHLESASISIIHITQRLFRIKDHDHHPDILSIDTMWKLIHGSPRLKYVNWKSLYEGGNLPEHAPYSRLTSLELDYPVEPSKILDILSISPNMRLLRVYGSPKAYNSKSPPMSGVQHASRPITHNVQNLSLTISGDEDKFFDYVTLPALRKLHLNYTQSSPPRSTTAEERRGLWSHAKKFQRFLLRSGCLLNDVWLKNPPYDDTDLRSHLSMPAFQTITRLRISGASLVTDDFIKSLTLYEESANMIMPNLMNLWLETEDTDITDGLFSEMVASRLSLGRTQTGQSSSLNLAEVYFTRDFSLPFGPADLSRLSLMESHELRISIGPGTLHIHGGL